MKKKTGMKLEAVHPVDSSLSGLKPSGRLNSVLGQKAMMPNRTKKKGNTDPKNYSGLCLCCLCSSVCTYPRDPGRPVLQCEEFEGISMPENKTMGCVVPPHVYHISESALGPQNLSAIRGLCASCDGLNTCAYPKPEGGVWHCEEFR